MKMNRMFLRTFTTMHLAAFFLIAPASAELWVMQYESFRANVSELDWRSGTEAAEAGNRSGIDEEEWNSVCDGEKPIYIIFPSIREFQDRRRDDGGRNGRETLQDIIDRFSLLCSAGTSSRAGSLVQKKAGVVKDNFVSALYDKALIDDGILTPHGRAQVTRIGDLPLRNDVGTAPRMGVQDSESDRRYLLTDPCYGKYVSSEEEDKLLFVAWWPDKQPALSIYELDFEKDGLIENCSVEPPVENLLVNLLGIGSTPRLLSDPKATTGLHLRLSGPGYEELRHSLGSPGLPWETFVTAQLIGDRTWPLEFHSVHLEEGGVRFDANVSDEMRQAVILRIGLSVPGFALYDLRALQETSGIELKLSERCRSTQNDHLMGVDLTIVRRAEEGRLRRDSMLEYGVSFEGVQVPEFLDLSGSPAHGEAIPEVYENPVRVVKEHAQQVSRWPRRIEESEVELYGVRLGEVNAALETLWQRIELILTSRGGGRVLVSGPVEERLPRSKRGLKRNAENRFQYVWNFLRFKASQLNAHSSAGTAEIEERPLALRTSSGYTEAGVQVYILPNDLSNEHYFNPQECRNGSGWTIGEGSESDAPKATFGVMSEEPRERPIELSGL